MLAKKNNEFVPFQKKPKSEEREYADFVEKFVPKRTTDDCFTPDNIYDVVADWVVKEYRVDRRNFVRPFWPDGDFEKESESYQDEIVVDNPPFSILASILRFYQEKKRPYFLFAPAQTIFGSCHIQGVNGIAVNASITYGNGARIATSFLTSLGPDKIRTAPDLYAALEKADKDNSGRRTLTKVRWPDHVLSSSRAGVLSRYGVDFRASADDLCPIRKCDNFDKGIFGGGYLLCDDKAAELRAAELRAAELRAAELRAGESFPLSSKEEAIVHLLSSRSSRCG